MHPWTWNSTINTAMTIENHPMKKCFWIISKRKKMLEQNAQDFWWIRIANYVEFIFICMVANLNLAKLRSTLLWIQRKVWKKLIHVPTVARLVIETIHFKINPFSFLLNRCIKVNLWGNRFSQNANQKFEGFLPYPLINFQGEGRNPSNFWLAFWEKRRPEFLH